MINKQGHPNKKQACDAAANKFFGQRIPAALNIKSTGNAGDNKDENNVEEIFHEAPEKSMSLRRYTVSSLDFDTKP